MSMTWTEGRKLESVTYNGNTTSYQYDYNGIRTRKTNADGSYIIYDIVDGKAVGETRYNANNTVSLYMRYIFDEGNSVIGISLWYANSSGWTDYYFVKNLQGDVLEVYQSSNHTLVTEYMYDAWGNILWKSGSLSDLNPFRYRGYYYDTETWFYYLQSRYYDPAIGRFINADAYTSTGQGLLGNNMFAYCGNNPVKYADNSGTLREPCTISMNTPGIDYLYDQEAEPFASKPLSWGTIALNGCGVFATYNAMISLGDSRLFAEIYDYYTASASRVLLCGKMGIAPWAVGRYFEEQGYTVRMTDDYDAIDALSSVADASILLYVYTGKSVGAHYVEYSKSATGYIGRNTGIGNGTAVFSSAVDYGYIGSNLYAIGIFIFKMEG